jgi:tetratricopeptide (TPR) repeat protein
LVEAGWQGLGKVRDFVGRIRFDANFDARLETECADAAGALEFAIVKRLGERIERYRQALGWAEIASRLDPDTGDYLTTLGVAQYRVGQFQQAVKTLGRSDKLNARHFQGSVPADLAFLAMTHHQLGQEEQDHYMKRLREAMNKRRWARDEEAQAFLREAEALLSPTAPTPNK